MGKMTRNLLILAAVLVIFGGIITGVGALLGGARPIALYSDGSNFYTISDAEIVEINESYGRITEVNIDLDYSSIKLVEGNSFSLKGSYNSSILSFEITEKDGILTVRGKNRRTIQWNLGFNYRTSETLTLTYPKGTTFKNVDIVLDLGSLEISTLQADSLKLRLSAGSLTGGTISVDSFDARLDLGSCNLRGLTVSKQGEFTMENGSLTLRDSSIHDLTAKNSLGSVNYSGTLTGTAVVDLDLGSLRMDLANPDSELSYRINKDLGSVTVNGRAQGSSVNKTVTSPKCTLDLRTALGSITLNTK
jgi:hypothetical protein